MSLADNIALDIQMLMNTAELAASITYNGLPITAIPEISEDNEKGNTFGETGASGRGWFYILESDVAWPAGGDKIMYSTLKCTVSRVASTAGGLHKVAVTYKESVY